MLDVKNLKIKLGDFELKNITFSVGQGGYFVLLGQSGIGKSVVLEMIAGLLKPIAGQIFLDGKDIIREKIQKRNIGLVYQDHSLFPHLTVKENIAYPMKCRKLTKAVIADKIVELSEKLGTLQLLKRYPDTLSGGEAQRVALARTLAANPKCLLLDEPLASLDVQAKNEIRILLRKINRAGQTVIHVTHDYEEAIALASHIGILENGHISQAGTPEEVLNSPKSPFIANFIGIKNFYSGKIVSQDAGTATFKTTNNLLFKVVVAESECTEGYLIINSNDITVSNTRNFTSALNVFEGQIVEIEKSKHGIELIIDISLKITALITEESLKKLDLEIGKKVFISFKATACKFVNN